MGSHIQVRDKYFDLFITEQQIQNRVSELADEINASGEGLNPYFIAVLNGSFMFAGDILKKVNVPCEISFIQIKSYQGTASSGNIDLISGLDVPLNGRHIIVLEDIIDTGRTMEFLLAFLKEKKVSSVKTVTLLYKPDTATSTVIPDIVGFEIPSVFVVGYGLDYNGHGRNLPAIYKLVV